MTPSTELNVTGFAKPGNYTVLINFDEDILKEEEINVTVQSCTIGEASLRDGTFCEPCNAATYNFDLKEDSKCQPCPDNGNCTTKVIVPKQGYWNSSPCSPHIQRCLTTHACDGEIRTTTLQEISENISICSMNEWNLETRDSGSYNICEYRQAQCVQVAIDVRIPRVSDRKCPALLGPFGTALRFMRRRLRKGAVRLVRGVLLRCRKCTPRAFVCFGLLNSGSDHNESESGLRKPRFVGS